MKKSSNLILGIVFLLISCLLLFGGIGYSISAGLFLTNLISITLMIIGLFSIFLCISITYFLKHLNIKYNNNVITFIIIVALVLNLIGALTL